MDPEYNWYVWIRKQLTALSVESHQASRIANRLSRRLTKLGRRLPQPEVRVSEKQWLVAKLKGATQSWLDWLRAELKSLNLKQSLENCVVHVLAEDLIKLGVEHPEHS